MLTLSTSTTIITFSSASRFWGALLASFQWSDWPSAADRQVAGPADWHVVELGLFRRGKTRNPRFSVLDPVPKPGVAVHWPDSCPPAQGSESSE